MNGRERRTTDRLCLACKNEINGPARSMKLKIMSDEPRFLNKAKSLGFTSKTWRVGDTMTARFHKNCYNFAVHIWKMALETRPLTIRRTQRRQTDTRPRRSVRMTA